MEDQLQYPLAVTHLLQHTLRSLCIQQHSQWVYAVFWRILPRNYPPPKWDLPGSLYDRSRGNRRNWILVWEDGFCNFAASSETHDNITGLQPELFFKMSHEIYNYGEGLIGKVASDHSHKWVFSKEPHLHQQQQEVDDSNNNQETNINYVSSWHNPTDSHPRTWQAQFQSGIKTIALIAVREGVVQLGAVNKVVEDLSYVILLRKKFSYLESIPGVLLPHPSSSAFPFKIDYPNTPPGMPVSMENFSNVNWDYQQTQHHHHNSHQHHPTSMDVYNQQCQLMNQHPMRITPSMSSLEALLSKLPSVGGGLGSTTVGVSHPPAVLTPSSGLFYDACTQSNLGMPAAKEEISGDQIDQERIVVGDRDRDEIRNEAGEASNSIPPQVLNTSNNYIDLISKPNEGF